MAGISILELSTLDPTTTAHDDYLARQEHGIQLLSMANLLDRSNAMVANHLADHYFWKWTPVSGMGSAGGRTVRVTKGSRIVRCASSGAQQMMNLDPGEMIRIGPTFETNVADEEQQQEHQMEIDNMMSVEDRSSFVVKDAWNLTSTGKRLPTLINVMSQWMCGSFDCPRFSCSTYFVLFGCMFC